MRRLIVLRPEPGASATMERARERGLDPVAMPLFEIEPVAWHAPDQRLRVLSYRSRFPPKVRFCNKSIGRENAPCPMHRALMNHRSAAVLLPHGDTRLRPLADR